MIDLTKDELDGYKNDLLLGCKIHDSVIDEIFTLALRGFEMQWMTIDQAPKDGIKTCIVSGGSWGKEPRFVEFLDMPFYNYEDSKGTPILSAPTHFIQLSALGEPK